MRNTSIIRGNTVLKGNYCHELFALRFEVRKYGKLSVVRDTTSQDFVFFSPLHIYYIEILFSWQQPEKTARKVILT